MKSIGLKLMKIELVKIARFLIPLTVGNNVCMHIEILKFIESTLSAKKKTPAEIGTDVLRITLNAKMLRYA